jgi:hypothetical protein
VNFKHIIILSVKQIGVEIMTNTGKVSKSEIISKLKERLEPLDYVYALWLEGADANGTADEYSDIDL